MKVKGLLFAFMIFLFPIMVLGKEYNFDSEVKIEYYAADAEMKEVHSGDVMNFSGNYETRTFLFVDGEQIGEICSTITTQNCINSYTADSDMLYRNEAGGWSNYFYQNYYLIRVPEGATIHNLSKMKQKHLYKSGDVIFIPTFVQDSYYYGLDNNLIDRFWGRHVEIIPQYEGKDVMWQVDFFDDGGYGLVCPHFKPYNYVSPEFKLTCKDKSIDYGKKTRCFVTVTAVEELEEVSFNLNIPNFKVSDIEYPSNIKSTNGSNEYNLKINENINLDTGMELMSFYLEGTKNENYTDDIKITNINYKDTVYEGDYEELESDLNIIPNVTNPKTLSSLLYILFPIIILSINLIVIKIFERKKKHN